MINRIKSHAILANFADDSCCENDVCVSFEEEVSTDSYAILKVDKYYNSLGLVNTPPSIDCLIVRKCIPRGYGLTLVELKNIESSKGFKLENIKSKFETVLFDFIKQKFKNPLDENYIDIKLFFVTNKEIYKRDLGLKMEVLINTRFTFNDRKLMITPRMPHPTIKKCYG